MLRVSLRMAAVAVAATTVGLVSIRTPADATRTVRIASHISIYGDDLRFSGRVTSANGACKAGRRVTLHRTNGDALGSTTTALSGKWKIRAHGSAGISAGHFYATVKRRSQGTAGTIYVCRATRSRTIAYH